MKDTVRKWMRLDPIDMDHFEGWLEAMAQKGLFFERTWAMGIVIRIANTAHPIRSSGHAQKNTV